MPSGHLSPPVIGYKSDRLTVVGLAGRNGSKRALIEVMCDCGKSKVITWANLQQARANSCGCVKREKLTLDEVGVRYGRLTVLSRASNDKHKKAQWNCLCDCGKRTIVSGSLLRKGQTRSCACLQRDTVRASNLSDNPFYKNPTPLGRGARNQVICNYRLHAGRRKLTWGLSVEECIALFEEVCYYCGQPPGNVARAARIGGSYTYSGIDRIDSAVGYEPDNVVPCCAMCNRMKMEHELSDFYDQIRRIVLHHPEIL